MAVRSESQGIRDHLFASGLVVVQISRSDSFLLTDRKSEDTVAAPRYHVRTVLAMRAGAVLTSLACCLYLATRGTLASYPLSLSAILHHFMRGWTSCSLLILALLVGPVADCAQHKVLRKSQGIPDDLQLALQQQGLADAQQSGAILRPGYKWDQFLPISAEEPTHLWLPAFLTKLLPSWLTPAAQTPAQHHQQQK